MKKLLFILSILYSYCIAAQSLPTITRSDIYERYPQYITFLPADKLDSVLIYANTDLVPVIYKVNKYGLESNEQLDSITQIVNNVIQDKDIDLAYVWIGGSASPEGPIWWNKKLGHFRSKALADYLLSNTDITKDLLRVENLEEDWHSVHRILQQTDFQNKAQILDIIETEPDNEKRKSKIRAIDGGKTWRKLIREVFPPFRNARMVIVCHAEKTEEKLLKGTISLLSTMESPLMTVRNIEFPTLPTPKSRFFALKTNTLFLTLLTANLGFEVELWEKWSLDVPIIYSPYDITPTRKLRILATQPELRWWTKNAGEGHFFGLHAHVAGFNIAINDNGRYQDPNHALWGLGIGYGYALCFGAEKR